MCAEFFKNPIQGAVVNRQEVCNFFTPSGCQAQHTGALVELIYGFLDPSGLDQVLQDDIKAA